MKREEIYRTTFATRGDGTYSLIEQAEAICKRESISFNQILRKALEEYVVRHGAGNNSFQLDKFGITWTKAQSVDKCGFKGCDCLAVGVALFVPHKQTYGLCKTHLAQAQLNSKMWADVRLAERVMR